MWLQSHNAAEQEKFTTFMFDSHPNLIQFPNKHDSMQKKNADTSTVGLNVADAVKLVLKVWKVLLDRLKL